MTTQQVQEKLYDRKSLFTLSGAAGAVWLLCLVIANFDQEHEMLSVTVYKFVALAVSMFLAVYMILRDKRKTRVENYLFAFFNGLLIFVNASGINAISNNVAKLAKESGSAYVQQETTSHLAGFMAFSFFSNDVDWWPNKKQEQRIKMLEKKLSSYNRIEDTVVVEDSIRREYITYKIETEKRINYITTQLEDCQEKVKEYEDESIIDPTGVTTKDDNLIARLDSCIEELDKERGKVIKLEADIRRLDKKLNACLEKTKPNEEVNVRGRTGATTSIRQLAADLTLCENKRDEYRDLYREEIIKNRKVKDSLEKCKKRYIVD